MNNENENRENDILNLNNNTNGLHRYNQKRNIKTSFDMATIYPVLWDLLQPGEKLHNLSFKAIVRGLTPLHPTLDNPFIDIIAFAIPTRLIKLGIEFNPENKPYLLSINADGDYDANLWHALLENKSNPPTYGAPDTSTYDTTSNLLKYFGTIHTKEQFTNWKLNSDNYGQDVYKKLNLTYLLAYKKIYSDFFRDKRIDSYTVEEALNTLVTYNLKRMDNEVSNPTWVFDEGVTFNPNSSIAKQRAAIAYRWLNTLNYVNVDNEIINNITLEQFKIGVNDYSHFNWANAYNIIFKNYLDNIKLSDNIKYATYKDLLISAFNANNKDKTNVELLGQYRFYQTIQQVVNNAKSNGQPLGEVGGISSTFQEGKLVDYYEADEEVVIMAVAVPNYKTTIKNYIDNYQWLDNDVEFNPDMLDIQNPIINMQFYGNKNSENAALIAGYQKPFNYMRVPHDVIAGDLIDKWSAWTYARDIGYNASDKIVDNALFKTAKKPYKDTLVSTQQDCFIAEFEFSNSIDRHIQPDYVIRDIVVKGE